MVWCPYTRVYPLLSVERYRKERKERRKEMTTGNSTHTRVDINKVIARIQELLAIVLGVGRSLTPKEAEEQRALATELQELNAIIRNEVTLTLDERKRHGEIMRRLIELREIPTGIPRELTAEEEKERLELLKIFWESHDPPCGGPIPDGGPDPAILHHWSTRTPPEFAARILLQEFGSVISPLLRRKRKGDI